ncbi:MAG: long-chain fatty acid--CoA ligase [Actinobacteria bacterium]|nr:long-chain fatty acid--CoA ligase [Actinomycetota bacterium]
MAVTSAEILQVVEGRTVPSEFLRTVATYGDRVALRWQDEDDGSWGEMTYDDYAEQVARVVGGYKALGVQPGDRVVLMLRNVPEFHVADMAAAFCGATPVSIYNSSSPEQVEYLVNHSEAKLAVLESKTFLDRFLPVRDELTGLETIVMLKDAEQAPAGVLTLEHFENVDSVDLQHEQANCDPDQLATIIYTSGTTGPPKGVMLTHRNIAWTVESLRLCLPFDEPAGKRVVSYLPMAHIAERATSHYAGAFFGYEVTCCPEVAKLSAFLGEVRPNLMFGVPRVWEKIHAGINAALAADPDKQKQFNDGVAAARPLAEKIDWGTATDEERATWDFLQEVFGAVRGLVGLDQCEAAITGAAPIPAEILSWFRAIGVPLAEIYGMSESSGPMTFTASRIKAGTVGPAIPGCEVKLADDGEVICRGGNVFQGYLKQPEQTAEALDEDGWLHSGDIGVVDSDGYFKIVDRKKELIITAGGKNISPANLEAALKMIPLVGQACAIGDQRPFVSALVVLDPEVAPAWATQQGIEFTDVHDLAANPDVIEAVEKGLDEVMAPFNNAERVKKVKILGEEWLPDGEMLTPTSKLKRRGVLSRYEKEIEALYA